MVESTSTTSSSSGSVLNVPTAQLGGKKKNGHKATCGCPICINMKHSKRGGNYDEEEEEKQETANETANEETSSQSAGRKKRGNGHKPNCGCPICKNMRKKRGGQEPDIENQMGDIEQGMDKGSNAISPEPASDADYSDLDAAERGEAGPGIKAGGTRRRKKRGTRKSRKNRRKTRRHKKRSNRR